MIVQFVGNFDAICQFGREWSASSLDQAFAALDLANQTGTSANDLCDALCDLELKDWICRADDDRTMPPSINTRWWVREHIHLTSESPYEVLGYDIDSYRILNDANDPVLYHESLFRILDPSIPDFWEDQQRVKGEVYRGPQEWSVTGYWERFHDSDIEVIANFWSVLSDLYPNTWAKRRSVH